MNPDVEKYRRCVAEAVSATKAQFKGGADAAMATFTATLNTYLRIAGLNALRGRKPKAETAE